MKRTIFLSMFHLVLTAAIAFIPASFAAADYKIVTIDFMEIINKSDDAKAAKVKLEKLSAESKKIIEQKKDQLAPLQEKVKEGKIKPGTPEGNDIRAKTKELLELMDRKEQELQKQYAELNQSIAEKAVKIIADYAKSNSIDLVLEKSEVRRGYVLFTLDTPDITKDILALVNK